VFASMSHIPLGTANSEKRETQPPVELPTRIICGLLVAAENPVVTESVWIATSNGNGNDVHEVTVVARNICIASVAEEYKFTGSRSGN
jgi:hypothetical protein